MPFGRRRGGGRLLGQKHERVVDVFVFSVCHEACLRLRGAICGAPCALTRQMAWAGREAGETPSLNNKRVLVCREKICRLAPPSPGRKQIKLIAKGAGTEGPRNSQPSASVQYVFSVPTLGKLCNTRVGRLATATSISGSRLQGAGFKGLASPGHNG